MRAASEPATAYKGGCLLNKPPPILETVTVLLIPGLLCDRFVWEALLERLPDAEVADLSTQRNLSEMARDCLARHPGPLRIAGHSMGGRVALEIVRQAPERVERLALLDTGVHPLRDGERESRAEIVRFAHEHGMDALTDRWLPPMVGAARRREGALMSGLREMVLRMDADLHERQITALVERPDGAEALRQVTCPLLLVVGRDDEWSPVAQHEAMREQAPHARLEVIEGAGHFAPVEQPDEVAELLVDFLSG